MKNLHNFLGPFQVLGFKKRYIPGFNFQFSLYYVKLQPKQAYFMFLGLLIPNLAFEMAFGAKINPILDFIVKSEDISFLKSEHLEGTLWNLKFKRIL